MKHLLLLAALLVGGTCLTAQGERYGHLNLGQVVSLLPETKAAESELKAYQQQLVAKGEEMAKAFQAKIQEFYTDVQEGTLPPVEQQKREAALQEERQTIVGYEQEIQQKLGQKRQDLLEPVLGKVGMAIDEVAAENGFVLIFDTSQFNAILFADESEDVLPLIKAKLGIE